MENLIPSTPEERSHFIGPTVLPPEVAILPFTAQPREEVPGWPRVDDQGFHADMAALGM